jgi:hypothetical protein
MTTNRFPNIGYTTLGRDFNFFESASITATGFGSGSDDGYQPDMIITFPTYGLIFTNETSGQVVEYSFNGSTVHGQLDGTATSTTRSVTFLNRVVSKIWFRLKSGSGGPATVTVTAWATR